MTTDLETYNFNSHNSDLILLSKEIEKKYPFTLIDKQNIQFKIDNSNSIIWIEDNAQNLIIFNKNYNQRFNSNAFLLAENYSDEFNKKIRIMFDSLNECIDKNNEPVSIQQKIKNEENQNVLIHLNRVPIIHQTGEIFLTLNELKIYPEEELTQNENELTHSSLVSVRNFTKEYLVIDNESKILEISDELLTSLNCSGSVVLGSRMNDIFTDEVFKCVNEFDNRRSESMEKEFEGLLSEKNNRYFSGRIFVCLLSGKQTKYLIGFISSVRSKETVKLLGKEKMIDSLMHNNPEPIYIFDKENLNFIDVNKAATDLYGYSKDEFLQMDITDLYLPEDIQTLLENSEDKQEISFFTGPFRQRKKDSSLILVEISKNSWTYEGRDAYLNIIKDVTAIKNLEKKIQLFKNVFDNTDDLLFVTDTDGMITYANNSTAKALGYSKEDIENSAFTSLLIDEERANVNANIFHSYLKDSITLVTSLKKSDDSQLQVELTASPVLDYRGEIDSFSLIATVEQNVQPMTREVVKEVVKEIKIEKPIDLHTVESKSDETAFLSSLFHQILTPINVIMGFVQELTETLPELTPDQKEMVDIINQNRTTLLSTMNTFVEYSNIVQNKYELSISEIQVTDLIDDLQKNFKEIIGGNKIEFAYGKISSSLKFESDGKKLLSFIAQLIKILMKTNKSKKIFISAFQYDEKNFLISVKDNYPVASDILVNSFDILFSDQPRGDKKDLGLPKLNTQLSTALLQILKGKFRITTVEPSNPDFGFIFPLQYSSNEIIEPKIDETKEEEPQIISNQLPIVEIDHTEVIPVKDETPSVENAVQIIGNNITPEIISPQIPKPVKQEIVIPPVIQDEPKEIPIIETSANNVIPEETRVEEIPSLEKLTPPPISTEQKYVPPFDISKLNCLYIEDQLDSQVLFKVQMKELKSIQFAAGFEEALPLLEKNKFDFILMDINLQGEYNGLDALRLIHKMPKYEKIPIVAVTAYVLPGDKEKFIAAGFQDFIAKPIFHDKMIESFQKIFHF
ncbi:MAG: PAS domain S-box protein [Ignavibacteriales bacterium]|nr:PAS domain S-box protein [Ignavibacteriales bacterium]